MGPSTRYTSMEYHVVFFLIGLLKVSALTAHTRDTGSRAREPTRASAHDIHMAAHAPPVMHTYGTRALKRMCAQHTQQAHDSRLSQDSALLRSGVYVVEVDAHRKWTVWPNGCGDRFA